VREAGSVGDPNPLGMAGSSGNASWICLTLLIHRGSRGPKGLVQLLAGRLPIHVTLGNATGKRGNPSRIHRCHGASITQVKSLSECLAVRVLVRYLERNPAAFIRQTVPEIPTACTGE
jgi:hypothetical protein